jgi:glycosyltransferase involved in cell wall biosynthesis
VSPSQGGGREQVNNVDFAIEYDFCKRLNSWFQSKSRYSLGSNGRIELAMRRRTPKVLIVGTVDVDARIELMCRLHPAYHASALGSTEDLGLKFARAGLPYHVYPMSPYVNPWGDLRSYRELVRIFRRLRPDIVHTFDTKPCVWGRLAARAAGVPVIVGTITGLGTLYVDADVKTRLVRAIYQPLQRLACHCSHLTIFYNREDIAQFTEAGVAPPDRCALVPGSGIHPDQFSRGRVPSDDVERVRGDISLRDGEVVVTMIARLCRSKGVLEFARAADIVRLKLPWVRFVLVGPWDNRVLDRLSAAEMDRVRQSVTWLGERKDIAAILAVSDICALPTFYREGIPRVLMEAASMGLPVIATDAPGCREVVRNEVNGLLIPLSDAGALASAVERLAGDGNLRRVFGAASRELAITKFDIDIISSKIAALYGHCLEKTFRGNGNN